MAFTPLIFISIAAVSVVIATAITVDLIPVDSPLSPFFDNSTSHVEKLHAAFRRSNARAREIIRRATSTSPNAYVGGVRYSDGGYLVKLMLGTPPQVVNLMIDTGSDLTWTQCKPCYRCFNQGVPLFDRTQSSTYHNLRCDTNECSSVRDRRCRWRSTVCEYSLVYADNAFTKGLLAIDTLTLGHWDPTTITLSNFCFGCSYVSQGSYSASSTGLLGLGQGAISLPTKTKWDPNFRGKFAYCLVPEYRGGVASKLSFGDDAVVTGNKIPLVSGLSSSTYSMTLTSVTLGNDGKDLIRIPFSDGEVHPGNFFVDSGTTLTYLPEGMFRELILAIKLKVVANTITDPNGIYHLCFQGEIEAPSIIFHFEGLDQGWELPMSNTFGVVMKDVVCLEMLPSTDSRYGILGSVAQQDFLVGHDLIEKTITFTPTDCRNH